MLNDSVNLLVFGDTPTGETGFARVLKNLCKRWHKAQSSTGIFDNIDYWAIGYGGFPHPLQKLYQIYPGGGMDWTDPKNLSRFISLAQTGKYSHCFILQDHFNVTGEFADALAAVCAKAGTRLMFYVPVDAPVDAEWMSLAKAADVTVAYTEYGKQQMLRAGVKREIQVIPHGVEFDVYQPIQEDRTALRKSVFGDWVNDDDMVMLNVSTNQRRKGLANTLQVQKSMMECGLPSRLVMHMAPQNGMELIDLVAIGNQLKLRENVHWKHTGPYWKSDKTRMTEHQLNRLYNACDVLISTSLGEGWGLPITEALASGMPLVAVPDNTACREIYDVVQKDGGGVGSKMVLLPQSKSGLVNVRDNSRIRYPVDVVKSGDAIIRSMPLVHARKAPNDAIKTWLNWDRIAGEFTKLMLA